MKCPICEKEQQPYESWFYESNDAEMSGKIENTYACKCGCEFVCVKLYTVNAQTTQIDFDPRDLDDDN